MMCPGVVPRLTVHTSSGPVTFAADCRLVEGHEGVCANNGAGA